MQLKSYAGELMSWPAGNARPTRSSMPWTSSPVTLLSARSGLLGAVVRLFAKARVAYRTAPCKAAAFVLGRIAHFLWAGGNNNSKPLPPPSLRWVPFESSRCLRGAACARAAAVRRLRNLQPADQVR